MTALLLAHAAATWAMVGLIWTIQLLHYPLFAAVGDGAFAGYEAAHTRRITALLALPWGVEAATTLALAALAPPGAARALAWGGALLLAGILASTVLLQVPRHRVLSEGFDPAAHRRLVATNWLRTVLWTARGAIALALLVVAGPA
ncbi:MAG: hypothetical protein R6T85_01150 [Egibacteraceae bacterium]